MVTKCLKETEQRKRERAREKRESYRERERDSVREEIAYRKWSKTLRNAQANESERDQRLFRMFYGKSRRKTINNKIEYFFN